MRIEYIGILLHWKEEKKMPKGDFGLLARTTMHNAHAHCQ